MLSVAEIWAGVSTVAVAVVGALFAKSSGSSDAGAMQEAAEKSVAGYVKELSEAATSTVALLHEEIGQLRERLVLAEKSVAESQEKISRLERQLEDRKLDLERVQSEAQSRIDKLETEACEYRLTISQLRADLEKAVTGGTNG